MLMRRTLSAAFLIGVALWASAPTHAQLQHQDKAPTISMDVTEAYLEDVLKLLSKQSGMNFVASEAVREKLVTLYLDQVPIHDALEAILRAHSLSLNTRQGKNLYVVTESGAPKVETITRVFQLRYARVVPTAGEILPTFGLSGSLIKETLGGAEGTTSTSTGGAAGGAIGGTGQPGAGGLLAIIRALLTEHGSVVADPRTNSLIVTDIPERMATIAETVAQLDTKPRQIFIEAEVLEVTLDTLRRIGIEYGTSTGQLASYTPPKRTSFFPLSLGLLDGATETNTFGTFSMQDASILLKLLATEKDVKFLARPRLLTLSGEVAEVRIIAEPVTGVTSSSETQTGRSFEEPERTTVGTILRVTPMVNDGKYVTMIIEPEVSRVILSSFNSKFQDPNRRLARTTVMVPSSGTAMIAGLISTENTDANRRVPGLGDLPIVGLPFKRSETERKNTEILLFITPHILEEDSIEPRPAFAREREQTPLSEKEQRYLQGYRKRILKERAIVETVDNIVR